MQSCRIDFCRIGNFVSDNSAILPKWFSAICRNGFCRIVWHSNWLTKTFQNVAVITETRSESAVWLEFSKKLFNLVTLEQIWRTYFFVHRWRCYQWSKLITPFRSRSRSGSWINRSLTISKKWSNDQIDLDQQSITTSLSRAERKHVLWF
jgi:hypothetical protein